MLIRGSVVAILLVILTALAACGGNQAAVPGADAAPAAGLPGLPIEPVTREATYTDGAAVMGDACVAFAGGVLAMGQAQLASAPGTIAWALYQIPEPVTPPVDVGWEATWYDPDPYSADPRDGYWAAFGNYDTGAWEIHGPFTQLRQRITFDPAMDVVSPGGDIALVLFCENGNRVDISAVLVGEDAGYGYEELQLAAPPGSFVGQDIEMALDPAGNPHALYSVTPRLMDSSSSEKTLRWLSFDGANWNKENLDLTGIDDVRWFTMAVGSGGRRAALIKERDATDDLHLFYDDGTGFVNAGVVSATAINQSYGGLTFVNSADDPLGDLDLLLISYSTVAIAPDCQTHYRTYDGAVMSPEMILYALPTRQSGRVCLSTGPDGNGLCGVPEEVGGAWEYYVGHYSAVGDIWDFLTVPAWVVPVEPDWEPWNVEYRPDFKVKQAANGDIIAGYIVDDEQYYQFGSYDGALWNSTIEDMIPTTDMVNQPTLKLDVYTSGAAATLTTFGSGSPQLSHGVPGAGNPWFRTYLSHEPWSFVDGNLAIDQNNHTHMLVSDFPGGGLRYYRRDAISHEITNELVDNGGGDFGSAYGFAHSTVVGDNFYVFYADGATGRVMMSQLSGGVTIRENEPIGDVTGDWPLYTMGAGYLEDSGLLYVVYLDYFTLGARVVSGHPGLDDWEVHPLASIVFEFASVADNESEVGILGYGMMLGEDIIGFTSGDPRGGMQPTEIVSLTSDHIGFPFHLAYNPFNEQWCMTCNDDDDHHVNYFLRTPLGSWIGPFLVAEQLGSGADLSCGGIFINELDGTVRIPVWEEIDGDPVNQVWVYSAPNGSGIFTQTQQLMTIDTTTHQYDLIWGAANASGEPVVAVFYRPIGDPETDARFFAPDGPSSWANIGLWSMPIDEFYPSLNIDDSGGIYFAGLQMDGGDGRVVVRYPW